MAFIQMILETKLWIGAIGGHSICIIPISLKGPNQQAASYSLWRVAVNFVVTYISDSQVLISIYASAMLPSPTLVYEHFETRLASLHVYNRCGCL